MPFKSSKNGILILIIIPLSLLFMITSIASHWYTIGEQTDQFNTYRFEMMRSFYKYDDNPSLDYRSGKYTYDYHWDGLKATFIPVLILLTFSSLSSVVQFIVTLVHIKSNGKKVTNKTWIWASALVTVVPCCTGFLYFHTFTNNIAKEDTWCPDTPPNSTLTQGYCTVFRKTESDDTDINGMDVYGPSIGYWFCLISCILNLIAFLLSFFVDGAIDNEITNYGYKFNHNPNNPSNSKDLNNQNRNNEPYNNNNNTNNNNNNNNTIGMVNLSNHRDIP